MNPCSPNALKAPCTPPPPPNPSRPLHLLHPLPHLRPPPPSLSQSRSAGPSSRNVSKCFKYRYSKIISRKPLHSKIRKILIAKKNKMMRNRAPPRNNHRHHQVKAIPNNHTGNLRSIKNKPNSIEIIKVSCNNWTPPCNCLCHGLCSQG